MPEIIKTCEVYANLSTKPPPVHRAAKIWKEAEVPDAAYCMNGCFFSLFLSMSAHMRDKRKARIELEKA
jgi:hypothetical protein